MKKLILTLIFILGLFISDYSNESKNLMLNAEMHYIEKYKAQKEREKKEEIYNITFDETIAFIKKQEGFVNKPYYCLAGKRTIGYGFMTKYIGKELRDSITREQADSVVVAKLKYYIKRSEKRYPKLNEFQHLSVAHMMYAKGEGTILKHKINNELKSGYLRYNSIVYFGPYEKSTKRYAIHYKRSRKYEYYLFYKTYEVDNINNQKIAQKQLEANEIINNKYFKSKLDTTELTKLLIYIDSLCTTYNVDYDYVKAIISHESRWNHNVKGATNDLGLMQITPIAAKAVKMQYDDSLLIPSYNVKAGIKLLAKLKKQFRSMNSVLVAYNAGSGNVLKHGPTWVNKHAYLKNVNRWLIYFRTV